MRRSCLLAQEQLPQRGTIADRYSARAYCFGQYGNS